MTISGSEIIAALGSIAGMVTGVTGLLIGFLRERQKTQRYKIHADAQVEHWRALATASPEGRKAIEGTAPPSQPPELGPAVVVALLATGLGLSAGGASVVSIAPRDANQPQPSAPQSKSCDPPCQPPQRCSGGTCVGNAESPEGAAAMLDGQKGGFMTLPGWQDTDRRTPWDYNPALDRQ